MIFPQPFDPASSTYTYIQRVAATKEPVIVDPVREQTGRGAEEGDGHGRPHGGAG